MPPVTFDMVQQAEHNWRDAVESMPPHLAFYVTDFKRLAGWDLEKMNYKNLEMLLSPYHKVLLRLYAMKLYEQQQRRFSTTRSTGDYRPRSVTST